MPKADLRLWDYISEAFHLRYPLPGLGALPINKLGLLGAFALGFLNPGFWFLGAGLESAFLWMLATDPRFQKYVRAKRLKMSAQDQTVKFNEMLQTLEKSSLTRLEALNAKLAQIGRLMNMNDEGTMQFIRETKERTLGQLPNLFLKLLVTRRRICESLEQSNADTIKQDLASLEKQLANPDVSEALAKSIRGNVDILKKRLENINRAKENLKLVEMELDRIENQVQLILEETALDNTPEALSAGIDRISATLGETERWVDSHAEFFNSITTVQPENWGSAPDLQNSNLLDNAPLDEVQLPAADKKEKA